MWQQLVGFALAPLTSLFEHKLQKLTVCGFDIHSVSAFPFLWQAVKIRFDWWWHLDAKKTIMITYLRACCPPPTAASVQQEILWVEPVIRCLNIRSVVNCLFVTKLTITPWIWKGNREQEETNRVWSRISQVTKFNADDAHETKCAYTATHTKIGHSITFWVPRENHNQKQSNSE